MTTHPLRVPPIARRRHRRGAVAGGGPRVVPLVFYSVLVVMLFFAMIYLRIALDRTAFELDELERSIELEQSRELDLRLEIARLQDPIRIANEAERIGMTHPDERRTLVIAERPVGEVPTPESPISAHQGRVP